MTPNQWIIGSDASDEDVTLWLNSGVISRRHCRLVHENGRFLIEDLASRNGVFVNGQRIAVRTEVTLKDSVQLANQIPLPWPDETLADRRITIGRDETNDVVLDDGSVSSQHAVLFREPTGRWLYRDLGSTNGTQIDGQLLVSRIAMVDRASLLKLGDVEKSVESLIRAADLSGSHPSKASSGNGSESTSRGKGPAARVNPETLVVRDAMQVEPFWHSKSFLGWTAAAVLFGLLVLSWQMLPEGDSTAQVIKKEVVDPPIIEADEEPIETTSPEPTTTVSTTSTATRTDPGSNETSVPNDTMSSEATPETITKAAEDKATEDKAIEVPPLEAIRDSLYWVIVGREDRRFRIGLALAVRPNLLLAAGEVIDNLQQADSFEASELVQAAMKHSEPILVDNSELHPQCKTHRKLYLDSIAELKQLRDPDSDMSKLPKDQRDAQTQQAIVTAMTSRDLARVFDLGVIRTQTLLPSSLPPKLESWLRLPKQKIRLLAKFRMSFFETDREVPYHELDASPRWQQQTVQPLFTLPPVTDAMPTMLLAKRPVKEADTNSYTGAMILDPSGRLAGIYSGSARLPPSQLQKLEKQLSQDVTVFDWISPQVILEYLHSL